MSFIPKPHEIYKHFKGNLYQITTIAEHTETGERLVIYQALYGDFRTYARPLEMFVSRVDQEKYPDADQEFRFELQGPDAERQREESGRQAADSRTARGERESPAESGICGKRESPVESGICEKRESPAEPGICGKRESPEEPGACGERESSCIREDSGETPEGEFSLDPMLLQFLDADSYEERLNILAWLHHRITDDMVTTMAIACDVEIGDGDIEERYEALKACLVTLERYECNRLR